jgi:hypothetical protein
MKNDNIFSPSYNLKTINISLRYIVFKKLLSTTLCLRISNECFQSIDTHSEILNPAIVLGKDHNTDRRRTSTPYTNTHHGQKVNILNFKCIRFPKACRLQEKFTSPTDNQLINHYYIILYNLNQEIVFCAVYACRAEDRNNA